MPSSLPPPSIPRAVLTAHREPGSDVQCICDRCWSTFEDSALEACLTCRSIKPDQGWPQLPYLFRNRYWFMRKLGRGGMGAVFLAYDPQAAAEEEQQAAAEQRPIDMDKSLVAVKVVQVKGSKELSEPQQRAQRRLLKEAFQNEIAAARMVTRYKLLFVGAKGHDDLEPAYLAMEYIHQGPPRYEGDVPWKTLSALLGKGQGRAVAPLPPIEVARIGIALLLGVGAMAQHNIVHNDIKPDNIFVRFLKNKCEVKIMDLGVWTLDQSAAETDSVLQGVGDVRGGTADYMSPEQAALFADAPTERRMITRKSDLHAVSSVLWELATGAVPFPVKRSTSGGGHSEAYRDRLTRLATLPARPPNMPEGLYAVLAKGLAKEPADRWTDASVMREQLKRFLEDGSHQLAALEKALSTLTADLAPVARLMQRVTQADARLQKLKQEQGANSQALQAGAESITAEIRAVGGELSTLVANLSGRAHHELSERWSYGEITKPAPSGSGPVASRPARSVEPDRVSTSSAGSLSRSATEEATVGQVVPRKKRPLGVVFSMLLVLVAAAGAFFLWQRGKAIKAKESLPAVAAPATTESNPPPSVVSSASQPVEAPAPSETPTTTPSTIASAEPTQPPDKPTREPIKELPPGNKTPTSEADKPRPYDRAQITAALTAAANKANGCKPDVYGPAAEGTVSIKFSAEGHVVSASLDPPLAGTAVGNCILGFFKATRIPPPGGSNVEASFRVEID